MKRYSHSPSLVSFPVLSSCTCLRLKLPYCTPISFEASACGRFEIRFNKPPVDVSPFVEFVGVDHAGAVQIDIRILSAKARIVAARIQAVRIGENAGHVAQRLL